VKETLLGIDKFTNEGGSFVVHSFSPTIWKVTKTSFALQELELECAFEGDNKVNSPLATMVAALNVHLAIDWTTLFPLVSDFKIIVFLSANNTTKQIDSTT
jgi:hypothetical protein